MTDMFVWSVVFMLYCNNVAKLIKKSINAMTLH